jgi:hypothetical protein
VQHVALATALGGVASEKVIGVALKLCPWWHRGDAAAAVVIVRATGSVLIEIAPAEGTHRVGAAVRFVAEFEPAAKNTHAFFVGFLTKIREFDRGSGVLYDRLLTCDTTSFSTINEGACIQYTETREDASQNMRKADSLSAKYK